MRLAIDGCLISIPRLCLVRRSCVYSPFLVRLGMVSLPNDEAPMAISFVDVPVTMTREASARITELGFQNQVEQMIDHARHHLPEVVRIEVVLNERFDMGGEPGVTVEAYSSRAYDPTEPIFAHLSDWAVDTFPPEVLEHLHIAFLRGGANAG